MSLEFEDVKGLNGKRKGREYEFVWDVGEIKEEEGKKLLSLYCIILFNDELVYKICIKVVLFKFIFEVGIECFVRDWRFVIVIVIVCDFRNW